MSAFKQQFQTFNRANSVRSRLVWSRCNVSPVIHKPRVDILYLIIWHSYIESLAIPGHKWRVSKFIESLGLYIPFSMPVGFHLMPVSFLCMPVLLTRFKVGYSIFVSFVF